LRIELVRRRVERDVEVLGAGLGAYHRTAAAHRQLHAVAALGQTGVALLREFHIKTDDLVVVALDPAELVDRVLPEPVGHLSLATLHDDLHGCIPLARSVRGV
jgi:hypothetical protein